MATQQFAIIIGYFNFSANRERDAILCRCIESLPDKARIVVVSHGFCGARLPARGNVEYVSIADAGVLWQRERFWNLALPRIADCEYVAWLDGDLLFENEHWMSEAMAELERYDLVQPFATVRDVSSNGSPGQNGDACRVAIAREIRDNGITQSYFSTSGVSLGLGVAPGFAWCAKRDYIARVGFPDFMILGSGDKAMLAAALGSAETYADALNLNTCMKKRYLNWAEKASAVFVRGVSCVQGELEHLVSGEYHARKYGTRYAALSGEAFSFEKCVGLNRHGAWAWLGESEFKHRVSDYFRLRND